MVSNAIEVNLGSIDALDPDENYFEQINDSNHSKYFTAHEFSSEFCVSPKKLVILNINIRSFFKNIDNTIAFLQSLACDPDILVLTETWLDRDSVEFANIDGYEGFHTLRDGRSGGVSVFCSKTLKCKQLAKFSISNAEIESCCVQISLPNDKLNIIAIYRPHIGTLEGFTEIIESIIHDNILAKQKLCLAGDFNLNLLNLENNNISNFIYNLRSLHFFPAITKPTRFPTGNSYTPTLLDQVWINFNNAYDSGIIWADLTDHCPVFLRIKVESFLDTEDSTVVFRHHRQDLIDNFVSQMEGVKWNLLLHLIVLMLIRNL